MAPIAVLPPPDADPYYSPGLRERYRIDAFAIANPEKVPETYVDIDYEFDEAEYHKRTEAVLRAGGLTRELPAGFPTALTGERVWSGDDFPNDSAYVYHLSDDDRAEIATALKQFLDLGVNGEEVNTSNFSLPTLGPRLEQIRRDIYQGRGFAILRGLDVDSYSPGDLVVVYLGLTSYVAETRGKQDQRGSMIKHVMNRDERTRAANKSVEKPFHTDTVCDVLCLLTKACAAKGGRSIMSSVWTLYNELAATRPDIIHTLAKPNWPFDTNGRDPAFYKRPLLYVEDGKVLMNFSRRLLTGTPEDPRTSGIPGLTEVQAEALDAVHYISRSRQIHTQMLKGDIRFLNNMGVLHRREAFEDDGTSQRHLLRLWLHNEEHCWKLPFPLRVAWARIFDDNERENHWDVEPVMKDGRILRTAFSCD